MRHLFFYIWLIVCVPGTAVSGTMTKIGDLNLKPDSHPEPTIGCSHSFAGTIEKGDLKKFNIVEQGQTITVVCLDSPGGSFSEAVKIAAYLKEQTIGTKIEANRKCESACALIFMAGSYHAHEVGALQWRIMHPTAKLGFHVPALTVRDGVYDKNSVSKAYDLAMQSMSAIIFKLVSRSGFEGGDSMKAALLGHMVSTPADKMFMIDTVDEAGRWDIMVGPTRKLNNITDEQFYLGCQNIRKWEKDESAVGAGDVSNVSTWVTRKAESNGNYTVNTIVDEFHGIDCNFVSNDQSQISSNTISLQNSVGSIFSKHDIYIGTFLPPETRLQTLAINPSSTGNQAAHTNAGYLCAVMQNDRMVESNPCSLTEKRQSGKDVSIYTWPSGAKTVLVRRGSRFSVNGAKSARTRQIAGFSCVLNRRTRKQFCFKPE